MTQFAPFDKRTRSLYDEPTMLGEKPKIKRPQTQTRQPARQTLHISRQAQKAAQRRRVKKTLQFIFGLFLCGAFLATIAAVGVFAYYAKDLPSPEKLADRQIIESTKLYDRSGEHLLYEIHGEEKRTVVPLQEISPYVVKATIAAEDDDFYNHKGVDFKGILRAAWLDVKGGGVHQGGSTITQQFIKNSILTPERTFSRKFKEVILALELERRFSKDEIIEMYLNEIPYGSNAYGIEAAAQTFFGKHALELTLAESAVLASLPRATTYYSPFGSHPEALANRQKYILSRMQALGYITTAELSEAQNAEIVYAENKEGIFAPHFVIYVKELLAAEFGEDFIERGGLEVITSLDWEKQKAAQELVSTMTQDYPAKFAAHNAALVALDPRNGQIITMVGSRDYFDQENDGNVNVTLRPRQPGSSFKPFAYAQAFRKGFTPDTLLFDVVTNFGKQGGKEYIPKNYDGKEHGPMTMRTALANSFNIPAVKTLYLAGVDATIDLAHQMGITTLEDRSRFGLSLVLGGGEVKLIDEVQAYGVFANDGILKQRTAILQIKDKSGKVLKRWSDNEGKRVLEEEVARQINSILSDNKARSQMFGSRNYLNLGERPVAAKTGTTQDYRDAWAVGYTPSLVAGVWVGNNDNSEMRRADGSQVAAPLWQAFMKQSLATISPEPFKSYAKYQLDKMILHGKYNEVMARVCEQNGQYLHESCCDEDELEEKKFREVHTILHYVDKDNPRGPVPENPAADPMYERWEKAIQEWLKKPGVQISAEMPPQATCEYHATQYQPTISLKEPAENATIENNEVEIVADGEAHFGFKKAEFYLDNTLFFIDHSPPPYTTTYVSYDQPGFHTLKVVAYDLYGNRAEDSVSINLKTDEVIYLTQPPGKTTLKRGTDFPYVLAARAQHDNGVQKVNFYGRDVTRDKRPFLIGSAFAPSEDGGDLYQVNWESAPLPSLYELYAILIAADNDTTQSAKSLIEVQE